MEQSLDEIIAGKHSEQTANKGRRERKPRGSRGGSDRRRGPRRATDDRQREPPCVLIKNLHKDINEGELRDLFREVGPISRISIDYDKQDKRTGRAWVLYNYGEDAAVAAGRFNGRRAVGQIITVKQVRSIGDLDKPTTSLRDRIGGAGKPEKRGARKAKAERPRGPKTQEELDAELDAYMNGSAPAAPEPAAAAAPAAPAAAAPEPEDVMIE